MDQIEKVFW